MFADALNSIITRTFLAMRREDGQTFVEYSMIGVLVAVGLGAVLILIHNQVGGALDSIQGAV